MLEWPAISAIAAACMVIGAIGKLIYDRAFADSNARDASIQAAGAIGRVNMLANEFSEHRVENARDIAELRTNVASAERRQADADRRLVEAEHRIASAIEDVSKQVSGVNDRLNRMLENRTGTNQ